MTINTAPLKPGALKGLRTKKASEIKQAPSIMVYGGSGIGKSAFVASASLVPEMSPVLHLDLENGISEYISDRYPDLDTYTVSSMKVFQEVFDILNADRNDEAGTVGEGGWRTVIIDNATESQKQGMAHLFPGSATPKFADVLTGSWGDGTWNKNSEQMRVMIRAFRSLPVNTLFTAWERDISKEDESTKIVPSFSPSFAAEAPGMFQDVYYYTFNRDGTRVLHTARDRKFTAKDRTGKLPAQLVNPSMQDIWDYWTGRKVATAAEKSGTATTTTTTTLRPRTN